MFCCCLLFKLLVFFFAAVGGHPSMRVYQHATDTVHRSRCARLFFLGGDLSSRVPCLDLAYGFVICCGRAHLRAAASLSPNSYNNANQLVANTLSFLALGMVASFKRLRYASARKVCRSTAAAPLIDRVDRALPTTLAIWQRRSAAICTAPACVA